MVIYTCPAAARASLISTQRRAPAGRDVVLEERHAFLAIGEEPPAERAPPVEPRRAARACVEINQ